MVVSMLMPENETCRGSATGEYSSTHDFDRINRNDTDEKTADLKFREKVERRQKVAQTIYKLWTCGGTDASALAAPLLDGRVDMLGMYVTMNEYDDDNSSEHLPQDDEIRVPHEPCSNDIDRIHQKDLSYSEFFFNYMMPNKPLVIRGLTDSWQSSKDWVMDRKPSLEYLHKHFGNDVAPVHVQTRGGFTTARPTKEEQTVGDYADWWQLHHQQETAVEKDSPLLYLKDWKFVAAHPNDKMYDWPEYFQDDWLNGSMGNAYKFVYLGPRGTCTRLHADVLRSYSWSTNVCGRKRWYLVPPRYTYLLHDCFGDKLASHLHADTETGVGTFFPGLGEARRHAMEIIQEPGETIFVPSGWHHTVENLESTLSINHNWLNGTNIHWSWDKLQKEINALYETDQSPTVPSIAQETTTVDTIRSSNEAAVSESNDMSQVGDDLVLLWLVLSKKARAILKSDSTPRDDFDTNDKFDLGAILPILLGIKQLIRDGKDQGLTNQCDCDIDDLIRDVQARLLPK